MTLRKRHKSVPLEILAVRKASREIDQLLLGAGFHARTRIKRSKKVYCRKKKHRRNIDD